MQGSDEEPRLARDCCWLRVPTVVPLQAMAQSMCTGRTSPLLMRSGLVAAFLAGTGAGMVAQNAQADGLVRCSAASNATRPWTSDHPQASRGATTTPLHSEAMAASGAGDGTTSASATPPRIWDPAQVSQGGTSTPSQSKRHARHHAEQT